MKQKYFIILITMFISTICYANAEPPNFNNLKSEFITLEKNII